MTRNHNMKIPLSSYSMDRQNKCFPQYIQLRLITKQVFHTMKYCMSLGDYTLLCYLSFVLIGNVNFVRMYKWVYDSSQTKVECAIER